MRRLFLFRPEPGARHSADQARAMGLDAVLVPLFAIEPIDWTAPDPADFDAILLTSANAIRHCGDSIDSLRGLPAHCVGEATALAANLAGLGVASVGTAGVDELLASIPAGTRLLHLCGEDRRDPTDDSRSITCVCVYRAVATDLPADLDELVGNVAAVHSPRAAKRLAELVKAEAKPTVRVAAISPAAATAAGEGWESVHPASEPSDSALLALCARLCED
jgi:uroporphyrinogen-III synthase